MDEMNKDKSALTTADLARTDERDVHGDQAEASERRRYAGQSPVSQNTELERQEREGRERDNGRDGQQHQQEDAAPLLSASQTGGLRSRWQDVQLMFVDDPKCAVERADQLVAEAIKSLAEGFAQDRRGLEQRWNNRENVSTEDLRVVIRRYRAFFERVLAV